MAQLLFVPVDGPRRFVNGTYLRVDSAGAASACRSGASSTFGARPATTTTTEFHVLGAFFYNIRQPGETSAKRDRYNAIFNRVSFGIGELNEKIILKQLYISPPESAVITGG